MAKQEKAMVEDIRKKGEENSREWYKFLRGENSTEIETPKLIIVDGITITNEEDITKEIEKFWRNILDGGDESYEINSTLGQQDLSDIDHEITRVEIREYLKILKNNKSPGPDNIPYEMFKNGGEWVVHTLHELFTTILREEKVPIDWNNNKVKLLHKGGHKSKKELKNYRPVALSNTLAKIFCGILNKRMKAICEEKEILGQEQNGFREDRRGEDNLYVVKELINRCVKDKQEGYFAFLDLEKAYDKIDRGILCKVLIGVGFSDKIVNIIKDMYTNTKTKFNLGVLETGWVQQKKGVRQGCTLSPLLFNLYLEELAIRIRRSGLGMKVGRDTIGLLLYADDVIVMAETNDMLQKMLDIVQTYADEFHMKFSTEKSGVIVVNDEMNDKWCLGDGEIRKLKECKYLGLCINKGGCEKCKGDKIYKAQQWLGRLAGVAEFRANKYEVI